MRALPACRSNVCVVVVAPGPTIALAMGEKGLPSRLLAAKSGAYLTFGALSPGQASAPGQPTVEQLRSLYRLPTQNAATQACAYMDLPCGGRHARMHALGMLATIRWLLHR